MTGSGWQYRNRAGLQGVTKMAIRRAGSNPGLLTVSVTGKNGSFPVTPSQVPPRFTIVVEGTLGLHGQCGEAVFGGPDAVELHAFLDPGHAQVQVTGHAGRWRAPRVRW